MSAQIYPHRTPQPAMNVFDKMLLDKQLASISNCLIIITGNSELHITDPDTITEIKATIIKRAASWN